MVSITREIVTGLVLLNKYRFLTISQFTEISGLSRGVASRRLLQLERLGWLGHIGNQPTQGTGKTPKTYYLKLKGYEGLIEHSAYTHEDLGEFVKAHTGIRWSPVMFHRLETVSLLIRVHLEVMAMPDIELIDTKFEYVRVKINGKLQSETTDTFHGHQSEIVRIVPDGAFAIENTITGQRALFFIELDRNTEPVTSTGKRNSIIGKFEKYDQYLQSGQFQETYREWGDFKNFVCLFVTPKGQDKPNNRIDNIRRASDQLDSKFHKLYKLGTYESVSERFFFGSWVTRNIDDKTSYSLIKER